MVVAGWARCRCCCPCCAPGGSASTCQRYRMPELPLLLLPPCSPQEVKKLEAIVKRQELSALLADVGALRCEMLRLEEELTKCQVGGGCGVGTVEPQDLAEMRFPA